MGEPTAVCPAADQIGRGVVCRIEQSPILWHESPRSLLKFCCGDYQTCPTWRKFKEAEWERRAQRMLDEIKAEG